jgi:hypothetical protein
MYCETRNGQGMKMSEEIPEYIQSVKTSSNPTKDNKQELSGEIKLSNKFCENAYDGESENDENGR